MNDLTAKLENLSARYLVLFLSLAFLLTFLLLFPEQNRNTKTSNKIWKKVKVYFPNSELNAGEYDCTKSYPVTRWIDSSAYPPMAAMRELLKGPLKEERKEGYSTSINSGVAIKGFWVGEEITRIRFSGRIEEAVGGSCRVAGIHSQILTTLKQFDNIDKVKVYVNGKTRRALQP